jgi:polysaccharide pyruvyl transferase WcaK-like protein
MDDPGRYNVDGLDHAVYPAYLQTLLAFVEWLLCNDWDVRLLIGDIVDRPIVETFKKMVEDRIGTVNAERVISDPVGRVEELLSQLAVTDFVVATRFHNVVLSLLLNKPVISISFHHKCTSLMSGMGLSEYCLDMKELQADRLIGSFCRLYRNAELLKPIIEEKAETCRVRLDQQYGLIVQTLES